MIEATTDAQSCPFTIANKHEAEGAGFCIEGDLCFLVSLGHYAVGCIGPCFENGQVDYWRFDLIDHEAHALGFSGKDATDILDRAIRCARSVTLFEKTSKMTDEKLAKLVEIYTPEETLKNILHFGEDDMEQFDEVMSFGNSE